MLQAADLPIHAIRSQIEAAVHIIVQTQRLPSGKRMVTHISEVVGLDPDTGVVITNDIFEERDEMLVFSGYLPSFIEETVRKGYLDAGVLFRAAEYDGEDETRKPARTSAPEPQGEEVAS